MNKEVVGLALLRIQLMQGQALPQRKAALDAKVMLTWVDSCIEIRPAFQRAKPFPVSAKLECARSSLHDVNQRLPVLGCWCGVPRFISRHRQFSAVRTTSSFGTRDG